VNTRARLLDVAVELVADHGVRGLTHDDVDAAAHAPAGSAQEVFPTRDLQAEVARTPDLRASYAVGADAVDTWALDYVTGLVFHELALPTPGLDAAGRVRTLVDTLGWIAP
jgi:hypothetical protein